MPASPGQVEVQGSTTGAFDAIVIGAGFAGIYMVHRLRESGFSVHGLEAGGGVGGTWYWNRYPGARCDSESMYYSFSFLPEFEQDWPLEQRYPTQPMILRYLEAVTDHLDLRGHFTFDARVGSVTYDGGTGRWTVRTTGGLVVTATYVITAVGALSAANVPRYPGAETFAGDQLSTANWPHDPVSFAGRRVGLIGTGSSGVQVLPQIAREAAHVTVFQRTPQFVTLARSEPLDPQLAAMWKANYREIRRRTKNTPGGIPMPDPHQSALELSAEERIAVCEEALAARRHLVPGRHVQRRRREPRVEHGGRRLRPFEDRRAHRRSGDGGEAQADDVSVGHQAGADRLGLLRDLQPAEREPRRHPRRSDRGDHARGHRARARAITSSTRSCMRPASTP